MQDDQVAVARIMLAATESFGFVLAGGYAIALHGVGNRPSEDVDVFTNRVNIEDFTAAVDAAIEALTAAGWSTDVTRRADRYARISASHDSHVVDIDMGVDYRELPPARMEIGPVLSFRDAAGSKIVALYSRGLVRDYVDVYELLRTGRVSKAELLSWGDAREARPMDRRQLCRQLTAATGISQRQFDRYDVPASEADRLRNVLRTWGQLIAHQLNTTDPAGSDQVINNRPQDNGPELG